MKALSSIIERHVKRREFLKMGAMSVLTACTPKGKSVKQTINSEQNIPPFDFVNLPKSLDQKHHVAEGYQAQILIRWGDPLFSNLSDFSAKTLTAEEQEKRFGYGNDYLAFFPLSEQSALLVVNHESTVASLMFEGEKHYVAHNTKHVPVEMMAHGLSVVELAYDGKEWQPILDSRYNRRITAHTPMELTGPAAGHPRLQTPEDPTGTKIKGTVHNCSGGKTPWGTVLSCEENILYYFQGDRTGTTEEENFARTNIGYSKPYYWGEYEERFRLDTALHEANRFGWVVEFDPTNPHSVPKKRTALGRFYHESANPILNADQKIVIYMGDDGKFEYLYRFVSALSYQKGMNTDSLLDDGELAVAKFFENGTVEWIPLVFGQNGLTAENGFQSQADVLIETRRAGDIVGATPMDRVEDVEPNTVTNRVYLNCTKNKKRGQEGYAATNPVNPRPNNEAGHIVELIPPEGDHTARVMVWDILILAGSEEHSVIYGDQSSTEAQFACPDNAAIDGKGRLWVSTDGSEEILGQADGLYAIETIGEKRGQVKRLFSAPKGAEVTGICFSDDMKHVFLSVQHPGHTKNPEEGFTTRWPDFHPELPPRPSVVVIRRIDGGVIGG